MVLRMKNVNILGVHWKIWLLIGATKNQYKGWGGWLPKKKGLDSLLIKRWLGKEEWGGDILMHTVLAQLMLVRWGSLVTNWLKTLGCCDLLPLLTLENWRKTHTHTLYIFWAKIPCTFRKFRCKKCITNLDFSYFTINRKST